MLDRNRDLMTEVTLMQVGYTDKEGHFKLEMIGVQGGDEDIARAFFWETNKDVTRIIGITPMKQIGVIIPG